MSGRNAPCTSSSSGPGVPSTEVSGTRGWDGVSGMRITRSAIRSASSSYSSPGSPIFSFPWMGGLHVGQCPSQGQKGILSGLMGPEPRCRRLWGFPVAGPTGWGIRFTDDRCSFVTV